MKVVFLHDDIPPTARPDELDVFVQVQTVATALSRLGHSFERLPFTLNLTEVGDALRRLSPDVVFNLVEAVGGQGRLIHLAPAVLDVLRIPYTGAGTEAMFLTANKLLTKQLLAAHGIATPAWASTSGPELGPPRPGRYIIKLVWEDASIGLEDDALVDVDDPRRLPSELQARAARLGGETFAEQFIDGREFNLALLAGPDGPKVLSPAEIQFVGFAHDKPKIVGYRAKWDETSYEYHHTPHRFDFPASDAPLLEELGRLARLCWRVTGLRGYARVDFRLDAAGKPWVLEINANPCLSPDAGFAAAAAQAGLSMDDVVARILADARRALPA